MLTAAALRRKLPPAAVAAATAAMATSASWRTARSVRDSGAAARTSARGYVRARLRRLLGLQCLERSRFHDAAYPLSLSRGLVSARSPCRGEGEGEGERERGRGKEGAVVAGWLSRRAGAPPPPPPPAWRYTALWSLTTPLLPGAAAHTCARPLQLCTSPPPAHVPFSCACPFLLHSSPHAAHVPRVMVLQMSPAGQVQDASRFCNGSVTALERFWNGSMTVL
jgi:hypothetical protein